MVLLAFKGKEGRTELVELLIEHDADVSALDNAYKGQRPNKWNALVYAAEGGYTALVGYLKEIGLELPFAKDDNQDRADGMYTDAIFRNNPGV